MDSKKITVQDCEKYEDKLTKQAINYTNMMKNPKERAQTAQEVITSIPEKDIRLYYKTTPEQEYLKNQLRNLQITYSEQDVQIKANWDALKKFKKRIDNQETNIEQIKSKSKSLETSLEENVLSTELRNLEYDRWFSEQESRTNQALNEQKTCKKLICGLALALFLQTTYIGIEFTRQPNTMPNKAYVTIKNWLYK